MENFTLSAESLEKLVHDADIRDEDWLDFPEYGFKQYFLHKNLETGASIALLRYEKGGNIPVKHTHASNQFMYCLSGRYKYVPTGTTLTPGAFYWNPKGSVHGPTLAEETSILIEIYDGPHYPQMPEWYDDEEDAR